MFGLEGASRAEKEAWCKGFNTLLGMLQQNRSHYRRLLGRAEMTSEEVLRSIYSRPWRDEPNHRTAPRRIGQPPGVPEVGPPAVESIDLYLIQPILRAFVNEAGEIVLENRDPETYRA